MTRPTPSATTHTATDNTTPTNPSAGGSVADDDEETIDRLTALAEHLGVASEDLDTLVHQVASLEASQTNNDGLPAQMRFLVENHLSEAEIADHVRDNATHLIPHLAAEALNTAIRDNYRELAHSEPPDPFPEHPEWETIWPIHLIDTIDVVNNENLLTNPRTGTPLHLTITGNQTPEQPPLTIELRDTDNTVLATHTYTDHMPPRPNRPTAPTWDQAAIDACHVMTTLITDLTTHLTTPHHPDTDPAWTALRTIATTPTTTTTAAAGAATPPPSTDPTTNTAGTEPTTL